jgi:hypothetical protein
MNQLGWIDFSPTHRNKVMLVMDMFKEQGVIDELGLGTIRDSLSDLLFPGTSTIQTRAKYFLLIPWIFQDIESSGRLERFYSELDELENFFVRVLRTNSPQINSGVIGRTLPKANPKRKPSSIYWNGLRTYEILKFSGSITDYVNHLRYYYKQKQKQKKQIADADGNVPGDDKDSNHLYQQHLWAQIPKPPVNWKDALTIDLTEEEATFLKERIILSKPNTLWSFALNHIPDRAKSFTDIADFLAEENLPEHLRELVILAVDFNSIMRGALIRYNLLIQTSRENGRTNELEPVWNNYWNNIKSFNWDRWDINKLWEKCPYVQPPTKRFVETWIEIVKAEIFDEKRATGLLKVRELNLKGIRRARLHDKTIAQKQESITGITVHENETVSYLNYRWNTVRTFLHDIQNGLANNVTAQ